MQRTTDTSDPRHSASVIAVALWNSPILVILGFAAGLIMSTMYAPPNDGDVWWQRWLGTTILQHHAIPTHLDRETFTAVGAPWVAHEWLFSTALAAATSHGLQGAFAFLVGCCALGTLLIIATTALRRGATAAVTSVALAIALIGIIPSLGLRVQVVAWLFMAAFFAVVREPKVRWWSVPVTVAWANVHASALLAPATIALLVGADLFDRRRIDNGSFRLILLLLATAAAVFVTPLGWHLPEYGIDFVASPVKAYIVEWQSPLDSSANVLLFLLAAAVLLVIACNQPRRGLGTFERTTLLTYFALAMSAVRHLPVFYIFALPIAASVVAPTRTARAHETRVSMWIPLTLAVLMIPAGIVTAQAALSRKIPLPHAAVRYVASHASGTRVYCADYSWCGMLVGERGVRVYLDGRADPYPAWLWAENARLSTALDVEPLLDRRGVNVVLVARSQPLNTLLQKSKAWAPVFRDANYAVFARKPRQSREALGAESMHGD